MSWPLLCKNQCIFSIFQDMTFLADVICLLTIDLFVHFETMVHLAIWALRAKNFVSHPLLVGNWVSERQVLELKTRVQVAARFAIVSSSVP